MSKGTMGTAWQCSRKSRNSGRDGSKAPRQPSPMLQPQISSHPQQVARPSPFLNPPAADGPPGELSPKITQDLLPVTRPPNWDYRNLSTAIYHTVNFTKATLLSGEATLLCGWPLE